MLPEEIRLEMTTSCPVTSYWFKGCTHSFKNSSILCMETMDMESRVHILTICYPLCKDRTHYHIAFP